MIATLTGEQVALAAGADTSRSLESVPAAELVPRPVLATAAGVFLRGALGSPKERSPLAIQLEEPARFTVYEDGVPSVVYSTGPTVGAALAAMGSEARDQDRVVPSPDTPLSAGLHVHIQRATEVKLSVGGIPIRDIYTHAETVEDLLDERNIKLAKSDVVAPSLSTPLRAGMAVLVTLVDRETEIEETVTPYRTVYWDDPDLPEGRTAVVQEGSSGMERREYLVTYRNGEETDRELTLEEITLPQNRIIGVGSYVPPPTPTAEPVPPPQPAPVVVAAPEGEGCARELTVYATWYTAESAGGSGITATGTTVQKGTVAVDPTVIPLGTEMFVPGYGYGRAEDTGGGIIGNHIDLGYGPDDVKDWRTGYVTICLLN